jgi:RNA-dependent RNA polymerase
VKEDYDQGFYYHESSRYLLGYIHSILKNGFYAGRGLRNNFLSYSNSQLKNHTSWFLSQITDGVDEKKIIQSMGNFEKEKNILKRYARRGQCFSTTKMFQTISKDEVNLCYPDIERDGYVFSDGCGLIRPDIAQEIAAKYKLSNVSAFQIRLGGAKGVLAVCNDPNVFKGPTKDYKILLRNS